MKNETSTTNELGNNANLLLCAGLNESAQVIFQNNKAKGFWDNERNVGELLMLITSELGEAMEAHRKGKFANGHLMATSYATWKEWFEKHYKDTFEDELADVFIRLFDLIGFMNINIDRHIELKMKYNESRDKLHGKQF